MSEKTKTKCELMTACNEMVISDAADHWCLHTSDAPIETALALTWVAAVGGDVGVSVCVRL